MHILHIILFQEKRNQRRQRRSKQNWQVQRRNHLSKTKNQSFISDLEIQNSSFQASSVNHLHSKFNIKIRKQKQTKCEINLALFGFLENHWWDENRIVCIFPLWFIGGENPELESPEKIQNECQLQWESKYLEIYKWGDLQTKKEKAVYRQDQYQTKWSLMTDLSP